MEFVDEVGFDGLEQFLSLGHFIPGVMQAYQHTLNLTGSILGSTHFDQLGMIHIQKPLIPRQGHPSIMNAHYLNFGPILQLIRQGRIRIGPFQQRGGWWWWCLFLFLRGRLGSGTCQTRTVLRRSSFQDSFQTHATDGRLAFDFLRGCLRSRIRIRIRIRIQIGKIYLIISLRHIFGFAR